MESIIYHILDHLSKEVTNLSLIDEDYGQLENLTQNDQDMYPLTYPAVLIELNDVKWSCLQGITQIGEARIRIRLIIDCYDDTHIGSHTTYKILERDELRKKIDTALQGFKPLKDGIMMRESSTYFTATHGIKIYETYYTLKLTECFTQNTKSNIKPLPKIETTVLQ